jgi:protein-arginine kinase activator protein McsA
MAETVFEAHSQIAEKQPATKNQPQMIEFYEFYCSNCKTNLAAIFQADGDFCAECWQIITHPNVEHNI